MLHDLSGQYVWQFNHNNVLSKNTAFTMHISIKGEEYNRLIIHHLFEEGVVLSNSSGVSSVISIMRFL